MSYRPSSVLARIDFGHVSRRTFLEHLRVKLKKVKRARSGGGSVMAMKDIRQYNRIHDVYQSHSRIHDAIPTNVFALLLPVAP